MDVILILSRDAYYVARYDDDVDKVTQYQRVALADVEKIEFGNLDQPNFQVENFPSNGAPSAVVGITIGCCICGSSKVVFIKQNEISFIWDKCCNLTLCFSLISAMA